MAKAMCPTPEEKVARQKIIAHFDKFFEAGTPGWVNAIEKANFYVKEDPIDDQNEWVSWLKFDRDVR